MNRNCLLGAVLWLCSGVAFAADQGASASLVEKLERIQTYSSHFQQTILDANGNEVQVTEGEFNAQRPGKFYWQTEPPYEQLVVGNEETVWVYDPDLEQVTIHQQQLANTPAAILSGDLSEISQKYRVEQQKQGKKTVFNLQPVATSGADFSSLLIAFKGKSLVGLTLIDQLGQKTEIAFSKIKTNKKMDSTLFEFVAPEGSDVITQ
ncbi:outer membrane lipoprotein chaperone LolA [Teredinibacter sp. KSP-S5-2]|uniref:outer membrane lipoprotein chaperone LolA n=1 Tax=Teredinibacter sp. KSP-S5-2 TaxID=3034506 RepID=UPI0029351B08|nr:outer membrane lipoprotein chaperone LolA [Teredinibacter sp. KSP-S5-2]WNO07546.1 outer membrane lipoprotein chaperone LolA [Teredinibacter sp. KSP-S5-2]